MGCVFIVMVLRRLTRGHARTEYTVLRSRLSLSFSDLSLSGLSLSFVSPHAVSAAPPSRSCRRRQLDALGVRDSGVRVVARVREGARALF